MPTKTKETHYQLKWWGCSRSTVASIFSTHHMMFGMVLWHINLYSLFNAISIFIQISFSISNNSVDYKYCFCLHTWIVKTVLFPIIQFIVSAVSKSKNSSLSNNSVLFGIIQFSISILLKCQNCSISSNSVLHKEKINSIWPIDKAISDATTPGQSGPGSDGNQGVLRIPQSSSIAGNTTSHC